MLFTRNVSLQMELCSTAPFRRPCERWLSAHQDIEAGRPLEVDETLGHAARTAARMGLSLPLLDAVYRIAAAIDRTSRAT